MNKLINKKSFDFTTNKLNSLSREPKSIKSKPQKFSDTGCKNLFLYRYRAGRMAFYIRYNETISKGKYRKKEIYLSDFEPYGPADQVENIRIEVNQRNKSRKDEAPLIHDPLFSSVILKFIKEGLEGLRVKYITQRKGFMEKYNPKHKRQIKTMLLNMVLHRTKKAELLQRLERAITADTQFIKDKRISKITTDDIDLLMQRLSSTPRQANLLKSHLSIVFKWAIVQGFCFSLNYQLDFFAPLIKPILMSSRNFIRDIRKELLTLWVRPVNEQRLLKRIRMESLAKLFSSI